MTSKYRWEESFSGEWRITYSVSHFLVAEGSGWSVACGRTLLATLRSQEEQGTDFASVKLLRAANTK